MGETGKNCLLNFYTTVRNAEYNGLSPLFLPPAQIDKSANRRYPVYGIWIVSQPKPLNLIPLTNLLIPW